jgi:simple sugar transport system ATP-binding protein
MPDELLRLEHICKYFAGVTALDDVSFVINRREISCLVGENGSGKSTMINIISGVYAPDEGNIYIGGHKYKRMSPITSIRAGIQVIYQDFSLFPNLTVAENTAINQLISSGKKLVNWKQVYEIADRGLGRVNMHIPLDTLVGSLSTADRQIIAIAKALLQDAKLIIMDEPTTALTQREVRYLFDTINELKQRGIAILFVSHKLNEAKEISDRTLILRNGKKVLDQATADIDVKSMAYHMTGRYLDSASITFPSAKEKARPLLKVEHLSLARAFDDVSFELYQGEVLGITGLLGSGRTELALSLFGEMPADSGKTYLEGREISIGSIQDALRHRIGYVPEDRIHEGLFLQQSIRNNIVVRIIDRLVNRFNLIDNHAIQAQSQQWMAKLDVKTPSGANPARSLSGGNQQRLVLAKWLASNPKILILNGPTVGVDVGSKADIHELTRELAHQGMGIILISDDIPEIMQTCSRVLLMKKGRITEVFRRADIDEEYLNRQLVAGSEENIG